MSRRVVLAGVLVVGLVASAVAQQTAPSRDDRWRDDLAVFAREFPKLQLDSAKLYPPARFAADIAAIRDRVPTATDAELVLGLMRVVAGAHVGHTYVRLPGGPMAFHRLPMGFTWYADALAVTSATAPYRELLGLSVVAIGARTAAQVEADVAPFIASETDGWLHQLSPTYIASIEVLQHLHLVSPAGQVQLTLRHADGTTIAVSVPADATAAPSPMISVTDALKIPAALYRKQPNAFYWFEYLADRRALYVQYNKCADDPKKPFNAFAAELFAFADSHPIDRIVVDLRFNGGGNSQIIEPFLAGLKSRPTLRQRGRLFALMGRGTFSSGLLAAVAFRNDLKATLIGEPSGEKPNSYGEVRDLTLPATNLVIQYATKFFRIAKDGDGSTFAPDVVVTRTLADALAGRDPVLDAALSQL